MAAKNFTGLGTWPLSRTARSLGAWAAVSCARVRVLFRQKIERSIDCGYAVSDARDFPSRMPAPPDLRRESRRSRPAVPDSRPERRYQAGPALRLLIPEQTEAAIKKSILYSSAFQPNDMRSFSNPVPGESILLLSFDY